MYPNVGFGVFSSRNPATHPMLHPDHTIENLMTRRTEILVVMIRGNSEGPVATLGFFLRDRRHNSQDAEKILILLNIRIFHGISS